MIRHITFILAIASFQAFSQNTIRVSKPKSSQVIVSADKMNVFYIGMDNPITVVASGVDPSALTIAVPDADVSGENGHFVVIPKRTGKYMVYVYETLKPRNSRLLDSAVFRCKSIPVPIVYLAGKGDGESVSVDALSRAIGIIPTLVDFDFNISFKVKSFELTLISSGSVMTFKSDNNILTSEMKSAFVQLMAGDRIIVENVLCEMPGEKTIRLHTSILTIK